MHAANIRIPASLCMLGMLLLAGCASGPRITSETDPSADFSRYRTFGFYAPLALEDKGYATPTTDRIKAAARAQMESRGYVFSERDPDLWVNLNAYMRERTSVSSIPTVDYNYYYSYRAGGYLAVPFWRDRTEVRQYTEGTLNVDVVDRQRNSLVWEGIAVGRMARLDPAERAARIDSTVAEIFERYPHRAGTGAATR
jgi:hypothetical protein